MLKNAPQLPPRETNLQQPSEILLQAREPFFFSSISSLNKLDKNFYGPAVDQRSHHHLSPPCTTFPQRKLLGGKQISLRSREVIYALA